MSVLRQYRLGMELHAFHGQTGVPHAHDLPVIGPGRDLQRLRKRFALDHQGMITGRRKWLLQSAENTLILVVHARYFAVHHLLRMHDLAAESLADALMTEAHAQYRDLSGEALDERN